MSYEDFGDANLVEISDGPDNKVPSPSNPMAVARYPIADYTEAGQLTLRRWRGGWTRMRSPHGHLLLGG